AKQYRTKTKNASLQRAGEAPVPRKSRPRTESSLARFLRQRTEVVVDDRLVLPEGRLGGALLDGLALARGQAAPFGELLAEILRRVGLGLRALVERRPLGGLVAALLMQLLALA